MTTKYRPYLIEAGEAQYAGLDPFAFLERLDTVLTDTGLDPSDLAPTRLLGHPLLLAEDEDDLALIRDAANADMLWHPMFWLPSHLASRASVTYADDDDDADTIETFSQWSVRVMEALSSAGLFNPATGEWLDVLALFGIDIDSETGLARVAAWQSGAEDDVLDTLDLTGRLGDDSEDSYINASHLAILIDAIVWHRDSQAIGDYLVSAALDDTDQHDLALEASSAALISLGSVPLEDDETAADVITGLLEDHWANDDDETTLQELAALCTRIANEYERRSEQAQQLFEDVGAAA